MSNHTTCTRCVMDTTDPDIVFDEAGVCNHCRSFASQSAGIWFPNEEGARRWDSILQRIKQAGQGHEYDSIIGLSGGVDSSYVTLKAKEWGLRPLLVHVDGGWDTELAVANIERVMTYCGFPLHTHVIDWEEMRDLQVAYFRSGIANQDVPQDHTIFASLYRFAVKNGIRYVIGGGNHATEGIFPRSWHGQAMDARNLRAIHRRYGSRPLKTYPTISFFRYYVWYPWVRRMRTVRPLNYMPFVKSEAIAELQAKVGWRPYPRKHGESLFTKFFQNYYLPTRFGYDKRRPHLSSLIASDQLTREEAIELLEEPLYDEIELESDIAFVCKKLGLERSEFEEIMTAPLRSYSDYPNWDSRHRLAKRGQAFVERLTGRRINVYS